MGRSSVVHPTDRFAVLALLAGPEVPRMSGKSFPHVRRTTTLPREPRRKTLTTPSRRSAIDTGEVDSIQELKARAALRIEQVVEELRMARGLRHGERGRHGNNHRF
jgi:hypothetical protein